MAASDARALAGHLAALDDEALQRLFTERRVAGSVNWADWFDAADALLQSPLLDRGFATLTAAEVAALQRAIDDDAPVPAPLRDTLRDRGFVADDGRPFRAVADAWPAPVTPSGAAEPAASTPESDEAAAERVFSTTAALADILQLTVTVPLGRIGSGAVSAADRRRLVDAGAATDPDEADGLISIAATAGLLAPADRAWLVTEATHDWLVSDTVARWQSVAAALRAALPAGIRASDGGWTDPRDWPGAHPFDPAWPEQAARLRALLRRWTMIGPDGVPAGWAAPVAHGGEVDAAALRALLPPEVDRVYLQNDLTAIAPGPLAPPLDLRLRSMTRRESRAQASTYRFTAESIDAALTGGETAQSLRAFLEELSLTGVPQPLAYEIERAAARHGTLRVGPDWTGRTRVSSDDEAMLRTVAVDQTLRAVGLVPDDAGLTSRSSPETVYWMLADARYPVVAVDADGRPRRLNRHRIAPTPDAGDAAPYAPLIARLRAAHAEDADAAWLGRELEQAVRERGIIQIVVRLPDGSTREVTLEATGLGGGRLRGLDRSVDVERTLPVSSITEVRHLDGT
ncbi:helicase-associated domain-containing protein [Microbacterium sp. MC2]